MPADIIPINPSVLGKASGPSQDTGKWPRETDEELFARVWKDAIESSRAQRAKTEAQWGRIGSLILDSCHQFESRHGEPDAWPFEEGLFSFVNAALDYYMRHAKRFGVDKHGRPKTKQLVAKGR